MKLAYMETTTVIPMSTSLLSLVFPKSIAKHRPLAGDFLVFPDSKLQTDRHNGCNYICCEI